MARKINLLTAAALLVALSRTGLRRHRTRRRFRCVGNDGFKPVRPFHYHGGPKSND